MSATDFEQNDDLEGLSSEELEERAFGPDPTRKRERKGRPRRSRKGRKEKKAALVAAPEPVRSVVVTKFCFACGAEVDARAEVCPYCGVRQPEAPAGRGRKSKGGAALLALVFGGLGVHRFYLGQPKIGLAMLLFCWTMIPALVGVVDFFRYLFMSDRRFAELYERPSAALLVPSRPVRRLERASPVTTAGDGAATDPEEPGAKP